MNWIKKVLHIGEKIKRVLKERPSKEDIENSDWTSCCPGCCFLMICFTLIFSLFQFVIQEFMLFYHLAFLPYYLHL